MKKHTIAGVLRVVHPQQQVAPMVFDSPHSGATYPNDFGYGCSLSQLRCTEDAFVDVLYADVPQVGAPLLAADFARTYIDVNRNLQDMDPAIIDGDWPDPVAKGDKARLGVGLIWRLCGGDTPIYRRKLAITEARARIDGYWRPYHGALRSLLNTTWERFGMVWHVTCHSMPTISNAAHKEGAGIKRPEICLGDRHGTSCSGELTDAARQILEKAGLQVAVNVPYAGAELVRAYSNPARRYHSLQIEVRRDLYMDEDTGEQHANFDHMRGVFRRLATDLATFALHQTTL